MINWQSLFFNSFWIVGLALLLAAFSYHYWVAQTTQLSLKEQLNTQPFQQLFWLSFVLVGIGLVGTSTTWWESGIWLLFTLWSVVSSVQLWRQKRPL
ncbi:MAG: hypothetical protein KC423_21670 [Anaerolineales bacterium]|nr:hypothetical protein [Anaerolineales bacterium]MCB9434816.1 hypothetical protein [Ardenticatenaceae bacterium]